ncbi:hypothetical protein ENTKAS01_47490 [Enterobacter sp. AS-1]|nr:hypothetical protein ENTKAS01_47490 [Enterobacter sp. AS-1]
MPAFEWVHVQLHQQKGMISLSPPTICNSAGDQDDAAKELKGFGGAGVLKVVEDDAGGTYRAVYTVKFAEAVFVLHCFQKKSKSGIATPKADMDIIRARLKVAEVLAQEL